MSADLLALSAVDHEDVLASQPLQLSLQAPLLSEAENNGKIEGKRMFERDGVQTMLVGGSGQGKLRRIKMAIEYDEVMREKRRIRMSVRT